jgi:hypothetical protein
VRLPWGRITLVLLALAATFAAAALLAPEIDASAVREPLKRALHKTTGRSVEIGEVRYQVFPFLGVSAADIVIPDDPRFGLEPVAYVGELQAGLHWPSLLTGHVRIGSVRLVEASINVSRSNNAGWNVPQLLAAMVGRTDGIPAPRVEIRSGRINFREGVAKSPFFLNEVDLDLDPPATPEDRLVWSYEASPARTDRSESGFGHFKGRGAWTQSAGSEGRLEIDIELERSLSGEVLTLVTGRDLGTQGRLSTRAHLDGPANNVRISGSLRVENSGPQGFFGFGGPGWTLRYQGRLDLVGQNFDVSTAPVREGDPLPLELRVSCRGLLSRPQWSSSFGFDGLPAPVLLDLARRFGVRAPEGLSVLGSVHGAIEYTQDQRVSGRVALRNAAVTLGEAGPLSFKEATVTVVGTEITLEPATTLTPGGNAVDLNGRWELETESAEFRLQTQSLPLSALRAALDRLPNIPPIPALEPCSEGDLHGELRFERRPARPDSPAAWLGEIDLREARCRVDGSPDLLVSRAALLLRGPQWSARKASGLWGAWPFTGELEFSPSAQRPYRASLALEKLDAEKLEAFFKPATRRPMSFLERTFRGRSSPPPWLAGRRAEGLISIQELGIAGATATGVALRYFWDGSGIDIPDATATINGGRFSGRWNIALGGAAPLSRLTGRADGIDFRVASFDADFEASWIGFDSSLADSLRFDGAVTARSLDFPEQPLRSIQACIDYDARRTRDRLRLSCLEAFSQGEVFSGSASHADSRWALDFTSPRRQFRLIGAFSPMEWTVEPRSR